MGLLDSLVRVAVRRLFVLVALCTAPALSGAQAPSYPACRIEKQGPVAFSATNSTDTLKISVIGNPCYLGLLTIEITSPSGAMRYKYSADFKRPTAVHWDADDMPQIAEDLVNRILALQKWTTSGLPPWLPKSRYYEQHYQTIEISRERYNSIRKLSLPLFSHPTHYEEWRTVFYDAGKKRAVVVLTGGV